jgi:lipopolysaccharide export system protein LptA
MNPNRSISTTRRAAFLRIAAAAVLLAAGTQAFAERADKDKQAVIDSDQSSVDDLNQTQLFTGNVVLTKGTIILRADQLTIKQDPEGYNLGVAVATQPGKLAYFKQKREGVDEYIEGQAERIEYDEKSDTVKLFNRAIVKRLAAGRDADEVRGARVTYDSRTEQYKAESNGTLTADGRDNRTRTILQPKVRPGSTPAGETPPVQLKRESTLDPTSGAPKP